VRAWEVHMVPDTKNQAAKCRRMAAQFKVKAASAELPSEKTFYLEAVQQWLTLAKANEDNLPRPARRKSGRRPSRPVPELPAADVERRPRGRVDDPC